jgi:hypothetical protein
MSASRSVVSFLTRGRSDYNGLQASLRQRASHGLEYLASYTLGTANTNQLGYYGSGGFTASEGTYVTFFSEVRA